MSSNPHDPIDEALLQRGWQAMQQQLDVAMPTQRRRKRGLWLWWTMAGAVVLLGGHGWWSLQNSPNSASQTAPSRPAPVRDAHPLQAPKDVPTYKSMTTIATNQQSVDRPSVVKRSAVPVRETTSSSTPLIVMTAIEPPLSMRVDSSTIIAAKADFLPVKEVETVSYLPTKPWVELTSPAPSVGGDIHAMNDKRRAWRGFVSVQAGMDISNQSPLAGMGVGIAHQGKGRWGIDMALHYQRNWINARPEEATLSALDLSGSEINAGAGQVIVIDEASLRYARWQATLVPTVRIRPRLRIGVGLQGSHYRSASVEVIAAGTVESAGLGNFNVSSASGSLDLLDNTGTAPQYSRADGTPFGTSRQRWTAGIVGGIDLAVSPRFTVQLQYQYPLTAEPFAAQRPHALLLGGRYAMTRK